MLCRAAVAAMIRSGKATGFWWVSSAKRATCRAVSASMTRTLVSKIGQDHVDERRHLQGSRLLSFPPKLDDARIHFSDRHNGKKQACAVAPNPIDERRRIGPAPPIKHRHHIDVQEVARHSNPTPRQRSDHDRAVSLSPKPPTSAWSASNDPRLPAAFGRPNQSASDTMTTASLPFRVTRCGSPASARSINCENSALAVLTGEVLMAFVCTN